MWQGLIYPIIKISLGIIIPIVFGYIWIKALLNHDPRNDKQYGKKISRAQRFLRLNLRPASEEKTKLLPFFPRPIPDVILGDNILTQNEFQRRNRRGADRASGLLIIKHKSMNKQFYQSKRFWVGIIGLITGISVILTGEKTLNQQLPEIVLTLISIVQTVLGITQNDAVYVGSTKL